MLGVLIAPDGNTTKLFQYLQSEASLWGAKVSSGHPSPLEAWQALHSNISAKLKYPLPACSLTQKQCKAILYPAIKSALPKAGIASNLVTPVRDAPISSGGAGIVSLYHFQGTSRTAMLVEQIFKRTTTGKLLLTCVEDLILEAGLYGSLWRMPFSLVSQYAQRHSLIYDIWKYMFENDICISTPHGELSPQRHGDVSIMDLASQHYTDTTSLNSIQRVRMAAGIIHLSDLCAADGKTLDTRYLQTNLPPPSKNRHDWPHKHHTTRHDMAKWRKFVRKVFVLDSKYLLKQLGPWIPMEITAWRESWDYFLSPDKELLWHRIDSDKWSRHLRKPHSRRSYFVEHLVQREHPQIELFRTTVSITPHTLVVTSTSTRNSSNPTHDSNFLHFGRIQVKKPTIDWFMNNISSSTSTNLLFKHILKGSAIGVSDGSYFPFEKLGSCAWILATPDGSEFIKGGGLIPGPSNSQSSYRSELGGQLGLASFVSNIILPATVSTKVTVACDGLGALQQVDDNTMFASTKRKDFDLISPIKCLWHASTIAPSTKHVKGHQDSSASTLSPLEELNCLMDHDAKDIARRAIADNVTPPSSFPNSLGFGTIICKTTPITSNLQSNLYNQITSNQLIRWLADNEEENSEIDKVSLHHQSFATARKESSLSIKLFVTKWISGDTATGRIMKRRKNRLLSNCPICDTPDEHIRHVLTCPSNKAASHRKKLLADLIDWLKKSHTHPKIENFINLGLTKWLFTNTRFDWAPESEFFCDCPIINKTVKSQLRIGWYYFLCGYISSDLVQLQSTHFISSGLKNSPNRWATNLIKQLWSFLHKIWIFRNECLHENDSIHKMTRSILLKQSITSEYNFGLGLLPCTYSSYFNLPLQQLLSKNNAYLKRWFLIVRSGREGYNTNSFQDLFSSNAPLRQWVKLKPLP